MTKTTHLELPMLAAAQAQKHVTVNEALGCLDAVVQLAVVSRTLTAPPVSPAAGARYIVPAGAIGAWAGWEGSVALFLDGVWQRLQPRPGWRAWVAPEGVSWVWDGDAWQPLPLAGGAWGAVTGARVLTEELGPLSGASVETGIAIPDRSIVLAVSTRTVAEVTGATSYDCGVAGEPDRFGGGLGAAAGSANIGVIGPLAVYADTPVRLTANGGAFTGGTVRVALHVLVFEGPSA